ncbi:ribonuclease H-like domain-containing protein [Tanacetum coccineum]
MANTNTTINGGPVIKPQVQPTYYFTTAGPPGFVPAQLGYSIISLAQPIVPQAQPVYHAAPISLQSWSTGHMVILGQVTTLPHAFTAKTLQDSAWNMNTGVSSHLNDSVISLSDVFNTFIYPSILVGDGHTIPVTNTGHSILPTLYRPLHLNNVIITPHNVKNLIYVRQFVRDNNYTIEFDAFGFSFKDFMTRRVLLRCDSTGIFIRSRNPLLFLMHFLPFKCEIKSFQCDHGAEFDNHALHTLFASKGDTLSRYKARLRENDSTQLKGIDVYETFSPVVKSGTIQTKYVVEILERVHMVNCNPSWTPVDTESKLGTDGDPVFDPTLYRSLAGDANPIRTLRDYSKPSHEAIGTPLSSPKGTMWERMRLHFFQISLRDHASNCLERLPAGSVSTWEDLTTRFLPGRTAKLRNDILMFQQHQGESLSEA